MEKCAAYLEACTIYAVNVKSMSGKLTELAETLKRAKHQCLVHIQLCAILSQLGTHEQALDRAKAASRLSHFCVECTLHAYKIHQLRYQLSKEKSDSVSEAMEQTHTLAKRALVMLKSIQELVKTGQIGEKPEQQMRSALGVRTFADWVYELSISDVMFIEPISTLELKARAGIRVEFSKDYMLDKVANVAVSYFCVSTELQFLRGKQAYNPERDKDAESYHMRSLRLLDSFFPPECPLVQHISQTYQKRFVSELQEIPEETHSPVKTTVPMGVSSRARTARNRSKQVSQDCAKLPILKEKGRTVPKSPAARKEGGRVGKGRVIRKASMEIRGKEQEKVRSASSFGMYQVRRSRQGKRSALREQTEQNRSFDRERRNKSAELVRGIDDSRLEDYLIGFEGRNISPRTGGNQYIVS